MVTSKLAMGFLLGLSPLHVITEVKAQGVTYKITRNHQRKTKFTMSTLKRLGTWNMNASYLRGH